MIRPSAGRSTWGARRRHRLMLSGVWMVVATLALASAAPAATVAAHTPVPNVVFHGLDQTSVPLTSFRDKVVLLNFWGTWCVPCLREIPELVEVANHYDSRHFEVVGVAVDSGRPEDIRAFAHEQKMNYRILTSEMAQVKRRFRVMGFPTTLLIDRHGMIQRCYIGPQTKEVFNHAIRSLLE